MLRSGIGRARTGNITSGVSTASSYGRKVATSSLAAVLQVRSNELPDVSYSAQQFSKLSTLSSPPAGRPSNRRAQTTLYRAASRTSSTSSAAVSASLDALKAYKPAEHVDFKIVRSEIITEHSAVATLYVHAATGAELLSVHCPAENEKVFGACFKTPPTDDTGMCASYSSCRY